MNKTSKNNLSVTSRSHKTGANRAKRTAGSHVPINTAAEKAKAPTKQQQLAMLILRDGGATLDQMTGVMEWLPHTARAALTGLKKKGYVISSDKVDGVRTYRAVAPQ